MNKSGTSALLVPLLAVLAIAFPFAMTPRSSGASSSASRQAAQLRAQPPQGSPASGLPPHSAARLIEDFLRARSDQGPWPDGDPRSKYSLDFIIATVPDPVDSRLPYFFDSSVDSIQRACEASGYVLDSFDLAWRGATAAGATATAATDIPRYRRDPSLLLFRSPDERKLLLVFLVGETPTSGLHKAAMAGALRQLANFFSWGPEHGRLPEELRKLTTPGSQSAIRIMGPTFSGSALSMDFALRDWRAALGNPPVGFRIVSGTATAIDPQEFSRMGGGRLTFRAVVPPDSKTLPRMIAYIQSLGYARVAMLSEASTAYGQTNMRDARLRTEVLNLPFPLHISQLRALSAKQRLSQQKSNSELASSPTTSIPLEEGDSTQPIETPPSFSPLEVSSADLVLSRLLSTISREEIHAVGILATDVRDTIFLAREIHLHCPSTLAFTVNSDLLYTHPEASPSTRGMLVFTPYPLFDLNQVWTPPFLGEASRLQFSNQAAEGVYNATLALLGRPLQMLEYGRPFVFQQEARPALWVTAVGRNGPLPVRLLDLPDTSGYTLSFQRKPSVPTAQGIYTAGSAVGIVLVSIVLIAFSLLVIRQYRSPKLWGRDGQFNWISRLLDEPVSPAYQLQARLYLLTCTVSLLSVYIVLAAVYWLPAVAAHLLGAASAVTDWRWLVVLATATPLTLACLLSLGAAVVVVARAFWEAPRQESILRVEVKAVVLGGCAASLCLALGLAVIWLRAAWTSPSQAFFVNLRAYALLSGLSPLVPLICVALAAFLWGFCSFRRLRMIDGIRSPESEDRGDHCFLKADTASFNGLRILESRVRELLERASAFSTRSYIGLVALAFIAGLYLFVFRFVPSYESRAFYGLFGTAFVLVYSALAMEFGRLWLIWLGLRRFLRRLAWHPMRAAYGRYRNSFQGFPNIDLATAPPTFTVLSFSVDQAERLLRLASALISSENLPEAERGNLEQWMREAGPKVRKAAGNLAEALQADADGDWRQAVDQRSRSQQALGELGRITAKFLEPWWRAATSDPVSATESPELKAFRELGEEFLAGRAILLISYVLPSLRNLGAFVLSGLLLMLISVTFYPFQPRNQFLAFNWVVILAFVGLAFIVLLQLERDPVLSMLNGTAPGQVKVSRQFTFRVLAYVMIPILALLSAQFPDTIGLIVSWFGTTPGH